MIVDSVKTNYVKYYFEISNTGDINIENIITSIRTPDYFNEERSLDKIPKIPIGDKINLYPVDYTIPSASPKTFNRENIFFKIELNVIFSTEGNEDKYSFFQFVYNIPWGAISIKEYYPTNTLFKDTVLTSKTDLPNDVFMGFENTSGSQYWVLRLPFEDEGDTIQLFATKNFEFYMIKSLQRVILLRGIKDRVIRLENNFKLKDKNLYLFSIIWSDSLTKFTVDDQRDSVYHVN